MLHNCHIEPIYTTTSPINILFANICLLAIYFRPSQFMVSIGYRAGGAKAEPRHKLARIVSMLF